MQLSSSKFKDHYKGFASTYDELRDNRNRATAQYSCSQVKWVCEQFKNHEEIIEFGCGTGKFTIPLAKLGKKVIAYDASDEMLEIVKDKAEKEGVLDMISLRVGDIENIDLEDNSCDAVLSIAVIRHFESEARAIMELSRIIRSEGVLVTDYLSKIYFGGIEAIKSLFGLGKHTKGGQWYPNYYRSKSEFCNILNINGLYQTRFEHFVFLPTFITNSLGLFKFIRFVEHKLGLGGVVYVRLTKE